MHKLLKFCLLSLRLKEVCMADIRTYYLETERHIIDVTLDKIIKIKTRSITKIYLYSLQQHLVFNRRLVLDVFVDHIISRFDRLQFQFDRTFEPTRKNLLRVTNQEIDVFGLWGTDSIYIFQNLCKEKLRKRKIFILMFHISVFRHNWSTAFFATFVFRFNKLIHFCMNKN